MDIIREINISDIITFIDFEINDDFADELAGSISAVGLINPIVVASHPSITGKYILLEGNHRLYALALLQTYNTVPAIVKPINNYYKDIDNEFITTRYFVENFVRRKLTPIQTAELIEKLLNYNYDYGNIALMAGKSEATIKEYNKLNNLSDIIKDTYRNKDIAKSSLLEIAKLTHEQQEDMKDDIENNTTKEIKSKILKANPGNSGINMLYSIADVVESFNKGRKILEKLPLENTMLRKFLLPKLEDLVEFLNKIISTLKGE